jgi:signal transduction histidine kinase/DNA-binding response OmpR family regulator
MILIVDDKQENIFSLKRLLEVNGFETDTASSGEEALKKILNQTYSLIILDVQMPGMDGFEVAEAVTGYSRSKDTPIIFLSAVNTEKKFIAKGYTSGGIDYITKPVDPDIFILKVRTLHRLYEQNRELHEIHNSLKQEVEIRKQAEDQLSRRVQELRTVLESLPQMAFTSSPNGEVEYVNEYWYMYSSHVQKFPDPHPADGHFHVLRLKALEDGKPFSCEVRLKNIITNDYRHHLLNLMPVKQNGEIIKWVGTFTDIQEQKQANELLEEKVKERTRELLDKNGELEASNHELQQFASVASHDLKEPLRKIQIFSSIIKERFLTDSSDARNTINRVIDSSGRMSVLINDLLNYSRLSISHLFQQVDLNEIIGEILNDLELSISEKDAEIVVDEIPAIDAIPGQMRQVFQNLISNALKFSRESVKPVIRIEAERVEGKAADSDGAADGEFCRITVMDNGIGFNARYVDKIFTIFQRLNPQEAYEGTGIGLAIARKIIEKHSGSITAEGKENEGAKFIIILPIHQAAIPATV